MYLRNQNICLTLKIKAFFIKKNNLILWKNNKLNANIVFDLKRNNIIYSFFLSWLISK